MRIRRLNTVPGAIFLALGLGGCRLAIVCQRITGGTIRASQPMFNMMNMGNYFAPVPTADVAAASAN